jgi:hypothetical protein
MTSRLVKPWIGDPTAEGARPELDNRRRRANVFHCCSRELTSPETRQERHALIAQRRASVTNSAPPAA